MLPDVIQRPQSTQKLIKIICQRHQQEKLIQLNAGQMKFLGCGLDHVVFQQNGPKHRVIIFKRKGNYSMHNAGKFQQLQDIYEQFLISIFGKLHCFVWAKQTMTIKTELEAAAQFFDQLELKIFGLPKEKFSKVPKFESLKIERSAKRLYISQNIFDVEKYNTIIEFKPKTVLPDIYTEGLLKKLSQKLGIDLSNLKQTLKQSQPIEKTRWFKKTSRLKKSNQNPFNIFKIGSEIKLPLFTETKCEKRIPVLSEQNKILLNKSIMECIHRDQNLLGSIHFLQALSVSSPQQLMNTNIQKFNFNPIVLAKEIDQFTKTLIKNPQIVNLSQYYAWLEKYNCIDRLIKSQVSDESAILLFLISLTWKDISLVYRANFNGKIFQNSQIWIIDDYLKDMNKIQQNIHKDEDLLKKYLINKFTTASKLQHHL